MFTSLVNGTLPFIHALVKAFADLDHPVGQFLQGLVDEGIGHLLVIGIGHGASYGGERVGITAKSDGQLDAVDIVFRFEETDDGGADRSGTGGIETVGVVEVGIPLVRPVGIVLVEDMLPDEVLVLPVLQVEDGRAVASAPLKPSGWLCVGAAVS